MQFITVDHWDEEVWNKWWNVYNEAFGGKNAKPEKVIRNMFRQHMCFFHMAVDENVVYAIALSGKLLGTRSLLIDYLAVSKQARKRGIGRMLVDYISSWAMESHRFESIVIEVEAEDTQENSARIAFWIRSGFTITSYVHHYKVVPEPYMAMYLKLFPDAVIPEKEETFFQHLSQFHQKCFRGV